MQGFPTLQQLYYLPNDRVRRTATDKPFQERRPDRLDLVPDDFHSRSGQEVHVENAVEDLGNLEVEVVRVLFQDADAVYEGYVVLFPVDLSRHLVRFCWRIWV